MSTGCRPLPRHRINSPGVLLLLSLIALIAAGAAASAAALGANKFDLMLDYLAPSPPAGANPEGYRRVRRAMAGKAIADARDTGLAFFRVAITGYSPTEFNAKQHDMTVWQNDPSRFWTALDAMFDDLDTAGIRLVPSFVWNIAQFPALGNDNVATFVREPNTASRRLLVQFIRDFIARYKARRTTVLRNGKRDEPAGRPRRAQELPVRALRLGKFHDRGVEPICARYGRVVQVPRPIARGSIRLLAATPGGDASGAPPGIRCWRP
jgi:hypothetical protein